MILPAIELTQEDLAKRWGEEDSEFLPAMLSCRERQLEAEMLENMRLREIISQQAQHLEESIELCRYSGKPLAECSCEDGCETNQMQAGEWTQPTDWFRMVCCDCKLVHILNFRILDGKVQFQAFREDEMEATQ